MAKKKINIQMKINNFNQDEKKYTKYFKWDINKLKEYMEVE